MLIHTFIHSAATIECPLCDRHHDPMPSTPLTEHPPKSQKSIVLCNFHKDIFILTISLHLFHPGATRLGFVFRLWETVGLNYLGAKAAASAGNQKVKENPNSETQKNTLRYRECTENLSQYLKMFDC